jgi:hypothetical protein
MLPGNLPVALAPTTVNAYPLPPCNEKDPITGQPAPHPFPSDYERPCVAQGCPAGAWQTPKAKPTIWLFACASQG